MPSKALLKAVEMFNNANLTDGVTAPFIFRGCESGGHAFIRHSIFLSRIKPFVQRCYVGYLMDQMYPPWNDNEEEDDDLILCPELCTLINYMFMFDKHLKNVRQNIKSKKDWDYVIEHTATVLENVEKYLVIELDRQYRIHARLLKI